ncbi:long-chain-fatty-acid--CoA ligase [Salirhabdus salicampi]|uniref:long-chain-fatty-acid--CoA ligase n=1 Tax=Salirhabdus salicampi TaxID=476102 RepID=UPI0020C30F87|nr:long-chain-fatty-acid--CoA ligase [Salirhabdus salicampi]MCP8617058.1 long-chain-fatty-acid--CoA ligase [Salirhabdus salicampi]
MAIERKVWHDHYPEAIPTTIAYEKKPLHDFLLETAQKHPEKKALYFMGKELTYSQVAEQSQKLASYLQALGLSKGDRVAIMLPNIPQAVIAYYGVLLAGGVVVQTNPLYTERELEYQLNDSGANTLICLDLLYPKAKHVQSSTNLENIIVASVKDYLPFPKNIIYPVIQKRQHNITEKAEHNGNTHLWPDVIKEGSGEVSEVTIDAEQDLALLQYTGGTTGFPKGVMLTHYNLVANTQMCKVWLYKGQYGNERILGVLPFFHVYGMTTVMNFAIMMASKMILIPKFEVEDLLKAIDKQKPTIFPGAPTIYVALLNHPDLQEYDISSIEACLSGSAPLPVEVQEQFEDKTKGRLVEGYGLTETSPVTHANLVWDKRVNGSVGIPWPDTDCKIVKNEELEEAEVGEVGEIIVKGPQVMKGYWNRPEETERTLKNGWLLTGDLGYMDENGYFYVVDRKKDMIIAGGYNVYPREVEEVLYEHEAIQEAVVAGIPDPYRGETVKAFVVLKENTNLTEEDLDAFCRKHLAAYKVPKVYEFRDELPKTAVGKILRRKLIEEEKEKRKTERPV